MVSKTKTFSGLDRNWSWLFGLGILFIFLGCLGLSMVVGLTLMSIFLLGVLFEIAGIAQLIDVVKSRGWQASLWHALIALFYIILGSFIIFDPILASSIITLLIAWTLVIIGLSRLMMAMSLRTHTTGWLFLLLSSIASIILGVLIIAEWPISGLWVVGLFISIELLINGWAYVFFSIVIRKRIAPKKS